MRSPLTQAPAGNISERENEASPCRIVISGYYGFDNLGDEAILSALVQQLRARRPDVQITALSGNPESTRSRLSIDAVHRLDLGAICRTLRGASLFISGGGSLFQDVTGPGSVPYYGGLLWLARMLGTRTMLLGQGVGPLGKSHSRFLVGGVARRADALTVRDQASRELLMRCGVPGERIQLTADPVLAMAPVSGEAADGILQRAGLEPGKPILAVSVRPWPTWYERQLKAFSAVLAQLASEWKAQLLLLPFHRPDDDYLIEELHHCIEARPGGHSPKVVTLFETLQPEEMLGLLSRVDMMVGMRLHALIMAAATCTPAVALVYDPKVSAFALTAGYQAIGSVGELEDTAMVGGMLSRTWTDRAELRKTLQTQQAMWHDLAYRNVDLALELAGRAA